MTAVDRDGWHAELDRLHRGGYRYLDHLTAIDRLDHVEVLAHVVVPDTLQRAEVATLVPDTDPHLASIVDLFPAADWHERETAEMFGMVFDGHPDPRPLLLREASGPAPLRKATALAPRVETTWPGAVESDEGRRARRLQLPPGVRASWLPEGTP
jgi:NADH-quinone oxidoreductase subunit C